MNRRNSNSAAFKPSWVNENMAHYSERVFMKPYLLGGALALLLAGVASAADLPADTNGDGKVSLLEYQTISFNRTMTRADLNRDGKISKEEAQKGFGVPGPMISMYWGRVDTNRDGFLNRAELDTMSADGFKRADKNHDGFLSEAEIAAVRRR